MTRFDRILTLIENGIAALALTGAVLLAITGVILRYLFDYVLFWAEEASIYLIILSTFIGAVIALRHKEHVGVELLTLAFKERGQWIVTILGVLILVAYCAIFGVIAWMMVTTPVARSFQTPALDLPLWLVQLPVPIGFTLMLIRALQIFYRTIRRREPFPDAEEREYGEEAVR
jgi:C4-dicarboxylate transporter DctQ subunit